MRLKIKVTDADAQRRTPIFFSALKDVWFQVLISSFVILLFWRVAMGPHLDWIGLVFIPVVVNGSLVLGACYRERSRRNLP